MSELRFDGRVAIVTGAGRGLGRAYAQLLASRGARVIVNDLGTSSDGAGADEEPARSVVEEIRSGGGEAAASFADITDAGQAQTLVDAALGAFGRIDIVINNAGLLHTAPFAETTPADLERMLAVHLVGSFNVTQAAWPHLVDAGFGRVLLTATNAVFGRAELTAYASSKGAVLVLARCLAAAGASHGINVNVLAPGAESRMGGGVSAAARAATKIVGEDPARVAALNTPKPPELVAPAVAFLVHEDCPSSGEFYCATAGKVTRLFFGETQGYVNRELTPEDVRDNWQAINDPEDFQLVEDAISRTARFFSSFVDEPTQQ